MKKHLLCFLFFQEENDEFMMFLDAEERQKQLQSGISYQKFLRADGGGGSASRAEQQLANSTYWLSLCF